jgi:hypothetical protein
MIPHLPLSSLHGCLHRHGTLRRPGIEGDKLAKIEEDEKTIQ